MLSIRDVLTARPYLLRELTRDFYTDYDETKCMRLGAALWRVREEKLYCVWGHRTFYRYCRDELSLRPTSSENWRIAHYSRLRALGLTDADMEEIESRHVPSPLLTRVRKSCRTREEIMEALRNPQHGILDRWRMRNLQWCGQKPTRRGESYTATIGPFSYSSQEFELIRLILRHLFKAFHFSHTRGVFALALFYKVWYENLPQNRYKEMKRLCLFHGFPQTFVDATCGQEAWKQFMGNVDNGE